MYIQEAHPDDGWQMDSNTDAGIVFNKAASWSDRRDVARTCRRELKLSIPIVADDMDNTVDTLYAGWPERMFVIDRDGRVAYAGRQGPWGFKPAETERALRRALRR